jgi:hypothetical protein
MSTSTTPTTPPFRFLDLPLELREQIYSIYFHSPDYLVNRSENFGGVYAWDFRIYEVNKQVYEESRKVWKRENCFVRLETPWPSAGEFA